MKLSEALEIQRDIMNSLKATQKLIIKYNSYKESVKKKLIFDIKELIERQDKNRNLMVSLKLAIKEANTPIAENIFKLSELKEEKKCYEKINIKEGKFSENNKINIYNVFITHGEAKNKVKELNSQIEKINSELEVFNETTEIDVDLSDYLGTKIKKLA